MITLKKYTQFDVDLVSYTPATGSADYYMSMNIIVH